ncbi:hypothetical protein M2475_000404 [Breznakia sp. PF5-3]|uniref:hypothetical protein n=1 Tax=unclassified Breznakia TaxID=2623764 RepID=UPI002406A9C6|nr:MULTISPECIES: hypothetical protein [unclassified Breznakia]MDF9824082.1 hypothetical protein [Breznakia sp. PM6-1]MDF9834852.1 hypothetical protein [Breznakia sp. PF5-3]MDF9837126.1 hypothetical protein [Breznakia sp. PFB2-8]MDF9859051.1 hypothetical protein [Breznakia sp. PH5-24]
MKKINIKTILITLALLLLTLLIMIGVMAIFISGPVLKNQSAEEKVIDKIRNDEDTCESIDRYSFEFVTYTCETSSEYVIYDKNGKKIASRGKKEAQFDEVKEKQSKYEEFNGIEPVVSYGYDSVVYIFENDIDMLVYDFENLELLFYSGGK